MNNINFFNIYTQYKKYYLQVKKNLCFIFFYKSNKFLLIVTKKKLLEQVNM
jgi:hypothetical protein